MMAALPTEDQPLLNAIFNGPHPPNPHVMQSVARLLSILCIALVVLFLFLFWRIRPF